MFVQEAWGKEEAVDCGGTSATPEKEAALEGWDRGLMRGGWSPREGFGPGSLMLGLWGIVLDSGCERKKRLGFLGDYGWCFWEGSPLWGRVSPLEKRLEVGGPGKRFNSPSGPRGSKNGFPKASEAVLSTKIPAPLA